MNESIAIPSSEQGYSQLSDSSSKPENYDPTPEEKKAIDLVDKLYSKAKNARKPYDENWLEDYKMFRGKQWKDSRPTYRHSEVINLIFRAIQSDVPILTDGRPMPTFIPQEPGDLELSQILNDVLESDWNTNNWLNVTTEIIYDMHIYGNGIGSLTFDPNAMDGLGSIKFQSEDLFYCFPDAQARNINENCNYFVFAEPKMVDELKREYPDKAQYIKPDIIDMARRDRSNFNEQLRYKSPTDNRSILEGSSSFDVESRDEALKVELYVHDMDFVEEETTDKDTQKTVYIQKLKYPNGRKICTVNSVLMEDGSLEFDDKMFPYLRMTNYILPREFWGMSEVEQLKSPQRIFNKLVSFSLDVLTLMGNPVWIVDSDSEVDTDNLFNRPGLIIEKAKGSEVRREEGVQLQPYVLQLIDRMKNWFDDISGSNDASRGVQPSGITAASAIEALQQASQTRLRQKTRNIDSFMQDFGQMYASRVFQFYDSPRIFRLTNDQNVNKYFKFHIEKRQVTNPDGSTEEQKYAKVRPFQQGLEGEYFLGEEKEYQIKGKFDVRVSSGSSLPFEKDKTESQSFALFDRGIIDAEEVLKNVKYPNAEAVTKRMQEKAAQQAQQPQPQK